MISIVLKLVLNLIKDFYITIIKLTKCDSLDIMEIIGFGLVVNSLYGVFKLHDIFDIYLLIASLYGSLKVKHFKKDSKC